MQTTTTTKSWYQSKIVLLAFVMILVFGSNIAFGWLTGQGVTLDQIQAVEAVYPSLADAVKQLQDGTSVFNVLGVFMGALIAIARVWFTTSIIPQSTKKELG